MLAKVLFNEYFKLLSILEIKFLQGKTIIVKGGPTLFLGPHIVDMMGL